MENLNSKADILVVDDVEDNVRLLARMLKRRGYTVATAADGFEALDKTKKVWPDLILLDVSMPKMDGFQVCQTLKEDEQTKKIPVIFLSAHSDQVDKLRGFQVGAVDYVPKPFHFHEVAARVATHIELYRHRRENERLRAAEQNYFDKITQLKNDLIHTVTHDLKNPLTSVKLSLSLLQRLTPDSNPKVNRYFDKIENDLDRMLIIISDLLRLSKIETTSTMRLRRVAIHDFLEKVIVQCEHSLVKQKIETSIVSNTDENVYSIFDPDQMNQVLTKVMDELSSRVAVEGHIEITYWTVGDEVLVSIADQASSDRQDLEPAEIEFDPEATDKGFPILQAVFERQGGRIWQDPNSGDYRFTLPY
ncbi:MAG: hybrid sensor histidine kinase/response regulator, partial [Chloroflexota bacterium]